jgi:putative methyltransferase (TIGR04325 family)
MWTSKAYVDHYLTGLVISNGYNKGILGRVKRSIVRFSLIFPRLGAVPKLRNDALPFIKTTQQCLTGRVNTVLDVGGGGDNYILVRRYLPRSRSLNWTVSDNSTLWDTSANCNNLFVMPNDSLQRIEMLDRWDQPTDLLILNGTLQYLPSIKWLFSQLRIRANLIVLNRTIFSKDPTHTVRQRVILGQEEFFVQNTVYNESDLVNQFLKEGYAVFRHSAPSRYSLSTDLESVEGYYKTITFMKT